MEMNRLGKIQILGDGSIKMPVSVSRPGPLVYHDINGNPYTEYRTEEEAFSEASLATLGGIVVTFNHPEGEVTPSAWKEVAVGHLENPRVENGWVMADAIISDGDMIQRLGQGDGWFVSAGYGCDRCKDPTGKNDFLQKNVRYNHLALLDKNTPPRAGVGARLHMDSIGNRKDAMEITEDQIKTLISEATAPLVEKIALMEKMLAEAAQSAPTVDAKEDPASPEGDKEKPSEGVPAEFKADAMEKALVALRREMAAKDAAIPALVERLVEAREFASGLGLPVDGKDLGTLRKDCAEKVLGQKIQATSPDAIAAYYDAAKSIKGNLDLKSFLRRDSATKERELSPYEAHCAEMDKKGRS